MMMMDNPNPDGMLYLRIDRGVYRFKVSDNVLYLERQSPQVGPNIPIDRSENVSADLIYDGRTWDLKAIIALIEEYERRLEKS